jgi:beta-glucosidase
VMTVGERQIEALLEQVTLEEQAIDRPEHRAVARRAAAETIALLKNDGLLPLQPARLEKVALIGPNAKTAQIMGGGSAQVNAHYRVTPFEGVAAAIGDQVELSHAEGCTNHKLLPLLELGGGFRVEYFNGPELAGEPAHTAATPWPSRCGSRPCPAWTCCASGRGCGAASPRRRAASTSSAW